MVLHSLKDNQAALWRFNPLVANAKEAFDPKRRNHVLDQQLGRLVQAFLCLANTDSARRGLNNEPLSLSSFSLHHATMRSVPPSNSAAIAIASFAIRVTLLGMPFLRPCPGMRPPLPAIV